MPAPITLLIAHPKELIRAGLRAMLAKAPMKIVGETLDGRSALSQARKLKPAVVILDVTYSVEVDPFEAARAILKSVSGSRVVMISALDNPTHMARARAAGASDFLLESMTAKDLVAAIENAAGGKPPASTGAFAQVAASMDAQPGVDTGSVRLTARESQVLTHVALGLSNDEIARSLGISLDTVKEHVQQILRKLSVIDRTQAAVWALKAGVA
jgi:DNA-binding NarL/FixJ family response regulator